MLGNMLNSRTYDYVKTCRQTHVFSISSIINSTALIIIIINTIVGSIINVNNMLVFINNMFVIIVQNNKFYIIILNNMLTCRLIMNNASYSVPRNISNGSQALKLIYGEK